MTRPLSKSQYVRGLQCHKALYLYRNDRKLMTPPTPYDQLILNQGTQFGLIARDLFPGGVLIKADHLHHEEALAETKGALEAGARVLYEAAFIHDDVFIRADILVRNVDEWNLYEVKSGTKVEDVHLHDAAVQHYVLQGAGLKVKRVFIAHANAEYVRRGQIDPEELVTRFDATIITSSYLAQVPGDLATFKSMLKAEEAPAQGIGGHCTKPYECGFKAHCWAAAGVPKYSVFNLAYGRMEKKMEMWNDGIKSVADITTKYELSDTQTIQVAVAKAGVAHVDKAAIAKHLGTLTYPLHFLDFETVNPAIPPYNGLKPYQQLPFQASVHIRDEQGGPLRHMEFLDQGSEDPRPRLTRFLLDVIKRTGSIIAYNKSFEGGCLKSLAAPEGFTMPRHPAASILLDMEKRLWDLADPFRKAQYAHPAFEGSWSIKKVLPVLVRDMDYRGLKIADGTAAMVAYSRLMTEAMSQEERNALLAALRAYCGTDTMAMVELLDHLALAVMGVVAA